MAFAMRRPDLGAALSRGLGAVARFPLPAGCAIAFTGLYLADQHDISNAETERLLSVLALGFFAALAGALFAEQRNWPWAGGVASSALLLGGVAAVVFLAGGRYDDVWLSHFLFLLPGLVLLVMVAPFLARSGANDAFWRFNQEAWFGVALGLASALVVALAAMALFAAFDTLFGIDVSSRIFSDVWVICLALLWPWIALYALPRDFSDPPAAYAPIVSRFMAVLLLVPIATIYLVVLYVYAISILLSWDLPRGNVANVACGFAAVGVITHLLSYPWRRSGSRWLDGFHKYFYATLFVPVALLAVAVGKRVGDYGVTEERYFLMLAAVWLGSMATYFLMRGRRLVLVPVSLSVLLIAASFGPWGATAASTRSQLNILHGLLTEAGLLSDGTVAPADGEIDLDLRKRISSVLAYLANSGKHRSLAPLFAGTNVDLDAETRPSPHDLVAALGFDFVSEWQDSATFSFTGPNQALVQVAGYDVLAERNLWSGHVEDIVLPDAGVRYALDFEQATGVLTVTAESGSAVQFRLAELAGELRAAGFTGGGGTETEALRKAMTLEAADRALRVRLLVTSLWGELDGATPKKITADVIVLIGKPVTQN